VTQPAETDDAYFLALRDTPVAQGRVGRDAGAEEGRGSGKIVVAASGEAAPAAA